MKETRVFHVKQICNLNQSCWGGRARGGEVQVCFQLDANHWKTFGNFVLTYEQSNTHNEFQIWPQETNKKLQGPTY